MHSVRDKMWWLLGLRSSFEARMRSLMNRKPDPSSFYHASLNLNVSPSLQGEQLGWHIDRLRRRLMPSMLTYSTSNDRNFISSIWFFYSGKSPLPLQRKDISINILFLKTRKRITQTSSLVAHRLLMTDFKDLKKQNLNKKFI